MKNFMKITGGVDMLPLKLALANNDDLWDQNTLRTATPGTAHAAVSDIWLRFNKFDIGDEVKVVDDTETIPYAGWWRLPEARELVLNLMHLVKGVRLGRVIITKLPVGKQINPHIDQGAPAEYYTRFQVAIQSLPGCVFVIEDEAVTFETGDVWKINNRAMHGVQNNSADDRICLIADIRIERQNG